MATTLLATAVLLGVLIFVHELGHFWAAKAVGIGVERFSIGLGPRIAGFTRGETEYVISAIPLGGYVKMQGMEDEVMEQVEGGAASDATGRPAGPSRRRPDDRDFDAKPLWARAFVISAGVIMNMLFAVLLHGIVAAAWGFEEPVSRRVMAVDAAALPAGAEALADIPAGAEIARVGRIEPETWIQLQRAFLEAPAGLLTVATESPDGSFVVELSDSPGERQAIAGALQIWADPVVGAVESGMAADRASIRPGDRVATVAGVAVTSWADMVAEIRPRPGERVEIGLVRDGAELLRVVELDTARDDGREIGRLGVFQEPLEVVEVRVGLAEAPTVGVLETVAVTRRILSFLKGLVVLDVSPREVGSIGTIAQVSGQAAQRGMAAFLGFMALFSVNLAILNLLPIPMLDGGHLVFLGIELVRGEKLSVRQRLRWSQVGLVVVVGLMVWALGNDVLRFLGL